MQKQWHVQFPAPVQNTPLQSQVPAHSELNCILGNYAYMGEMNRMTQFKENSQKYKDNISTDPFHCW